MGQTQDGSRGLFPSSYVDHIPEALPMSNKPPAALIQHAQVTVKVHESYLVKIKRLKARLFRSYLAMENLQTSMKRTRRDIF